MAKWYNKDGEHEQALSNEQITERLKLIRALKQLFDKGIISQEVFFQGHNAIEEGVGDMLRERDKRLDYRAKLGGKKGRRGFKDYEGMDR